MGAPALNAQVNDASQGSLTVGTSAVITHTVGEPIVNEHTAVVPTLAYAYGKRSAEAAPEASADPYLLYGGYGLGYGHGYYGGYYGHGLGYYGGYGVYGKRLLRPPLRPRPTPTFCTVATTATALAMATAMATAMEPIRLLGISC